MSCLIQQKVSLFKQTRSKSETFFNDFGKLKLTSYLSQALDLEYLSIIGILISVYLDVKTLGRNSQNFLRKFVRFFVTLKCFYGVVIHRK